MVGYDMSRLIFLNLPAQISKDVFERKLKEPKVLQDAVVTDVRFVKARKFAFVGYASAEDAQKSKEYFDGTYAFGGGKAKVDYVREDPLEPKARESKDRKSKSEAEPVDAKKAPNKRLQEFMDVMKGEDPTAPVTEPSVPSESGPSKKGKEKATPEPEIEQEEDNEDDDDAAWLAKRQQQTAEDDESEPTAPKMDPEEALILSTGRLFVRNLAFVATADDLKETFGEYGPIVDVHMPVSQQTGEPLGTAFVLFRNPEEAVEAWKGLDKMTFKGRLLHVLPGRARPGDEEAATARAKALTEGKVLGKMAEGHAEVKTKQADKRKEATARGLNWATLYMNSDAVAASVADRMGISKADLLSSTDSDDISPAVKLALAETQVISETKAYFEKEGIVLDALKPNTRRSQTVILVKNIPYGTSITTLQDIFAPFGELKRVLLPPSGTIGVVEFANAMDAGRAFRGVAYRRLGNAVIYLEKGPVGMFKDPNAVSTPASKETEERAKLADKVSQAADKVSETAAPDDEAGATLFVKNLAFATTTERLISVLSSIPGFSFAQVKTKPDPKRPGERLSMGYAFVGFKTKKQAQAALEGIQGFKVDGHELEARFAQRGAEEVEKETKTSAKDEMGGKTKGTKLLVKNLPFEATKKDVRSLFSAYGTLKSLRLPKKSTLSSTGGSSSRGFAFLEFTTHAEAQRAMDAVKHSHLLGRHLVTQWANEDADVDVDALREKVSRDARLGDIGGKKRKLNLTGNADDVDENDGLDVAGEASSARGKKRREL